MSKEHPKIIYNLQTKLKRIARQTNRSLPPILLLFLQERFLYRLSKSQYGDKFVLKGGLLFHCLTQLKGRPTKDIDLIAQKVPPDLKYFELLFREVCQVPEEDGIIFDPNSLEIETNGNDENAVLSAKFKGFLGNMYELIRIDLSFKGVESVPSIEFAFPVILDDFESPKLKIYSKEAVIAEKFHATVVLSEINTRMKDFYDIDVFASNYSIEGKTLLVAIAETFQQRNTLPDEKPVIFMPEFAQDKKRKKQWVSFLERIGVKSIPFDGVMMKLTNFLQPINASFFNKRDFTLIWNPTTSKWESL